MPFQEKRQYLSHVAPTDASDLAHARARWLQVSRGAAKRKLGEALGPEDQAHHEPKKRHVKTHAAMMEVSNMLQKSAKRRWRTSASVRALG